MKSLGNILLLLALVYLAACVALFAFQRSFLYFPPATPALQAPKTTTLAVPGAAVKVSERPHAGRKAVLYLGGNGEDVSASLPLLDEAFPQHALYLLHYRGYTGSTGKPTEKNLVSDALLLFDGVVREHGEVVVIGRSLGSGVALQVAAARPVHKLVLITPYDSVQELAALRFSYFPVRWILRDKFESWRHAPRVKAPTLVLAAEHDEVIPAWSTARLLGRFAGGVATMKVIGGAGHNTISGSAAYVPSLQWAR